MLKLENLQQFRNSESDVILEIFCEEASNILCSFLLFLFLGIYTFYGFLLFSRNNVFKRIRQHLCNKHKLVAVTDQVFTAKKKYEVNLTCNSVNFKNVLSGADQHRQWIQNFMPAFWLNNFFSKLHC